MKNKIADGLILGFVCALVFIGFRVLGPSVETSIKPPLNSLSFNEFECDGFDVIVSGVLDKEAYGSGEAQFKGLALYNTLPTRDRLVWTRVDLSDSSPQNRSAGVQSIVIRIKDGCGVEFRANTRHISPYTGLILPMSFGPFNGGENESKR